MANLYSKATGNWTTLGTFNTLANGSGVDTVPNNTHDVVIQSGHNVTLNSTGCAAKSCTVNSGGTLTASTSVSCTLTLENDLINDGTTNFDVSSDVTKVCTIILNNANSSGTGTLPAVGAASPTPSLGGSLFTRRGGSTNWQGAVRKRWTTLTSGISVGATSATVANATGWQVGDVVKLSTTDSYSATPHIDSVTIATVNTGTGAITWVGGTTYAHTTDCYVVNFSSNLIIGPAASGRSGNIVFYNDTATAATASKTIKHVQFNYLKTCSYGGGSIGAAYPFLIFGADVADTGWVSFDSNIFNDFTNAGFVGIYLSSLVTPMVRSNNVFDISTATGGADYSGWGLVNGHYLNSGCVMGEDQDMVVIRSTYPATCAGISTSYTLTRPKFSGCDSGLFLFKSPGSVDIVDPDIQSCNHAFRGYMGKVSVSATSGTSAKIGNKIACTNVFFSAYAASAINATLTDCNLQSGGTFINSNSKTLANAHVVTLVNKGNGTNADVTLQEIYHPYGTVKRNNATTKRSTSSLAIAPTTTGTDTTYTVSIPCAAGASITVLGSCRLTGLLTAWNTVSAVISGLSATGTLSYSATTAAQSGSWEDFTLTATNNSGADGNFTLTLTGNSASGTPTVYFDGIPTSSPFVTKARHYGYLFDQTTPNATANTVVSASESTAGGYTGITVTGGTSTSSTVLSASQTFQKLYDYTQAWSCTTANLGYAIPVTGAGVAGSPVLFAQGNLTVNTGYVLNGSGSINMGSYTLTTETATAQSYTYTGGSWSQATTAPTFSGGTLTLSGEGTWTFTANSSPVIKFTPTANAVTYAMGGGTFGGTLDLRNTHATRTITVELPSGTTYTTANNTGAAITVSTPQVYQSVTVTGAVSGSRIQIYDTTSSTELYNGTPSFPYTWTDPTPAAATRAIRLRVAKQSGVTAKNFIDANIGTCATSGSGKDISYLVSQTDDYTYNLNAIDGSTVTGITVTAGPTKVSFNIPGGAVSNASIYAYQVYWQATATGIANETSFISSADPANYIYTDTLWKNTNPSVPLTISGGWARDSVTGLTATLFDTTGYPIFASADASLLVTTGSGPLTPGQADDLSAAATSAASAATYSATAATKSTELHKLAGLDQTAPLVVTSTTRTAGSITQTISGTDTVTVTRV